jgi:predicted NBD/HSP70 family sugar kinase
MVNGYSVVADVSGSTLRIGRYAAGSGRVEQVSRFPVEGLARHPDDGSDKLRQRVVGQLGDELARYLDGPHALGAKSVGISFAGPVTAAGSVTSAPAIWGAGAAPVALAELLAKRLGRPVVAANDITAATWWYAATEYEPFCLLTVGEQIGNKVFRGGEVLVDDAGHGGELGHWPADPDPDAVLCACGGRGHLCALASGRGVLDAVRRAAVRRPEDFARSRLAMACEGDPARLTGLALVAALIADDPFATAMLRRSLRYLASAVIAVFTAIGVRRFIVIGGFAIAVGRRFIEGLTRELLDLGCFGLDEAEIRGMARLGRPGDDHGLIGMGRMLDARAGGPA